MEENLKRNFNLTSLQHGPFNFAAISLDDRWQVSIDNVIRGVKCHSNEQWKRLEYSQRLWRYTFAFISLLKWTNWLQYYKHTIMDKSLGTVVQFERLLIHAKVYPHATNTVRPYSLPPPHRQCWNRQGTIPLIFQHCIGWGGGRGHGFVKRHHCFLRQNLWNA